jgi:hypothetical protein
VAHGPPVVLCSKRLSRRFWRCLRQDVKLQVKSWKNYLCQMLTFMPRIPVAGWRGKQYSRWYRDLPLGFKWSREWRLNEMRYIRNLSIRWTPNRADSGIGNLYISILNTDVSKCTM